MNIVYAHAVKNPFDNSIPKPFEFREVEATVSVSMIDGEWIAEVCALGQSFRDSSLDQSEAVSLAIFEAEYCLMDQSRKPWNP